MHSGAFSRASSRASVQVYTRQCRQASTSNAPPPAMPTSSYKKRKRYSTTDPEAKPLIKFVNRVIKHPDGPPSEQWTHIRWQRGEEMRLKAKVERADSKFVTPAEAASNIGMIKSMAQEAFGAPDAVEQTEDEDSVFAPEAPLGSFVELRRNDLVAQGVVVGGGFIAGQWRLSVLTTEGESWLSFKDDIYFTIPSFCSTDLAMRCGTQPIPEGPIQLNARVEVLKQLRAISREVENNMVGLAGRLVKAYDTLRAKDPNAWADITVTEIAKMFRRNPTAIHIFAAHKLLMNDPVRFVAASGYQANQTFHVRPSKDVDNLLKVNEWIRKKDPVLEAFAEKVLEVMKAQDKLKEDSLTERPTRVPAGHTWGPGDRAILQFLVTSLRPGREIQTNPYMVGLTAILKRVFGNRPIDHIDSSVHHLLVSTGVYAPWQDLLLLDKTLGIDLEQSPTILDQREHGVLKALKTSKSRVPTNSSEFYAMDPLDSVRHDWGDMPVYIIDDVGAEELDDGISIERIPSEPGNLWVHAHIADPASLIPPTNFLAQQASEQSESRYLVQGSWPLFPKCIVHDPIYGLSLGTRSKNGGQDRVLTFSTKLDPAGNIIDYTVRAGFIRNLKIINYDSIDAALNMNPRGLEYPFGNRPHLPLQQLSPQNIEDMKALYQVAQVQRNLRLQKNWFSMDLVTSSITRVNNDIPIETMARIDEPGLYRGFPALNYSTELVSRNAEDGTRATVAELMKLACRTASRFCMDRNIPVLRRTSSPMIPASEEVIQMILNTRDRFGYVREEDVAQYIIYRPGALYMTHPAMHYGLGIPEGEGYVRVTSPLRRYGDLVAHWQIHQGLLMAKDRVVKPKFDLQWMEDFAATLSAKDHLVKTTTKRNSRFWKLLFIKRWIDMFGDGRNQHLLPKDLKEDPLDKLEGYLSALPVTNALTKAVQAVVQIPRLGLREIVVGLPSKSREVAHVGMTIPLKLRDIQLGVKPLMTLEYDNSR